MIFAASGLVIFNFVGDFYSEEKLNISMDDNTQAKFDQINDNFNSTRSDMDDFTEDFRSYSPGGTNSSVEENQQDSPTGGLLTGSLKAIVRIPSTLGIFGTMIATIGSTIGIDPIIIGFILSAVVITVIIIITAALLQKDI